MIPTKDTLLVTRAGELDDWGRPTGVVTDTYKCRIDYNNQIVMTTDGKEVVSKAVILIKGEAVISNEDSVSWVDAFGTHEAKPLTVGLLKDVSNKVIFTKVVV